MKLKTTLYCEHNSSFKWNVEKFSRLAEVVSDTKIFSSLFMDFNYHPNSFLMNIHFIVPLIHIPFKNHSHNLIVVKRHYEMTKNEEELFAIFPIRRNIYDSFLTFSHTFCLSRESWKRLKNRYRCLNFL